jgi:hypothetical protein
VKSLQNKDEIRLRRMKSTLRVGEGRNPSGFNFEFNWRNPKDFHLNPHEVRISPLRSKDFICQGQISSAYGGFHDWNLSKR